MSRSASGDEAALGIMLADYQAAARSRGLPWELNEEDLRRLTGLACHYCGIAPGVPAAGLPGGKGYTRNGVDTVDGTSGYIPDNCLPCCETCLYIRGGRPYAEFIEWLEQVAAHQALRNVETPGDLFGPEV